MLATAIEDPNPVLYFEHKHLYRRLKADVPEERYTIPFGKARIHREGEDISVITWGAMVHTADEAAEELAKEDVSVEVIDLRTVMPWDKEAVLASVVKTSKVLVLHEDTRTGGFGAEIAATIAEEAFEIARRAGEADRRARHTGAVLAAAREGVHPAGRDGRGGPPRARRVLMATGTIIDVVMPQMGVSVSEGTIVKWLRSEGETIEADEALLEISTDKVDTEVPSPGTGVVPEILVHEGETVDVGTKLAEIAPEVRPQPSRRRRSRRRRPSPSRRRGCGRGGPRRPHRRAPSRRSRRPAARSAERGRRRQRERQDVRLAGRGAHRRRARRRRRSDPGHRPGRPRDQEGHPRLHRVGGAQAPPRPRACPRPLRPHLPRRRLPPRPPAPPLLPRLPRSATASSESKSSR